MARARSDIVAVVAALLVAGCGGPEPPRRDCFARVWIPPDAPEGLTIEGSWNGWQSPGLAPEPVEDGWRLARLGLFPGEHGYLLVDGSGRHLDGLNPLSTWDLDRREVSLLDVPDCREPAILVERVELREDAIELEATFLASQDGAAFDPATIVAETRSGERGAVVRAEPETGKLVVVAEGLPAGKVSLGLRVGDEAGGEAEIFASGWTAPATGGVGQRDPRDEVVYQIVVDRFRDATGGALAPPPTPGARAGGHLDGVTAEVAGGRFSKLGVSMLWLSPAYVNPVEAREGVDGRLYEGYHGYWPLESRAAEPRIGGEAALDRLVARGHDAGLALILDLVPNHVYEDNARYRDHLDWFGPPGCVCGTPSCPWSEHIQTCWFTPYLPDVDWPVREARDAAIEDARFWSRRFDLDGFRIDAVPMMPRAATRRVADATRRLEPGSEASFLLGEVFTGPGEGALGALRYYLGPAGLDAVFDFPLMWAIHDVIGRDTGRFGDIDGLLAVEEQTFGPASLARILDNHDTVRFLSVAEGDAGGDPWDAPAVQPIDETPYRRLMLAQALVFTLPGIPVLYQGDEVGVAGGGDPDNRRVLPGDDALSAIQGEVLEFTQRLGQLRRCSEALRRGARTPLSTASHRYAFRRDGERPVVVVLETEGASGDFTLPTGSLTPGEWVDLVSGESLTSDGSPIALDAAPGRARVLVRADDPCAAIWAG